MIRRHATASAFLETAGPFLAEREAEHNLFFGIGANLIADEVRGGTSDPAPYLATLHRDGHAGGGVGGGEVVGAALMTPPHQLLVSCLARDLAPATERAAAAIERTAELMVELAGDLASFECPVPAVLGPFDVARAFADAWCLPRDLVPRSTMTERIYRLERVRAPTGVPGALRIAGVQDRGLLHDWVVAFHREAFGRPEDEAARASVDRGLDLGQRTFYLWEVDGRPVSLAATAGPTPRGFRIGPVYTPPGLRGHGFASAVTAAATQTELDQGRELAFLFTDIANPTSNRIYQAIGYEPVIDVVQLTFTAPGAGADAGATPSG